MKQRQKNDITDSKLYIHSKYIHYDSLMNWTSADHSAPQTTNSAQSEDSSSRDSCKEKLFARLQGFDL